MMGGKIGGRASIGDARGAAALEFAIIAPLFFMLTFGAITGALLYTQRSQLTHATRESARYGAATDLDQPFPSCSGSQGECWARHVREVTKDRAFGDLDDGVAERAICVAVVSGNPPTPLVDTGGAAYRSDPEGVATGPGGSCYDDTTSLSGADADPGVRVQVVAEREGELNAVLFHMNPTLSSEASAYHEEN